MPDNIHNYRFHTYFDLTYKGATNANRAARNMDMLMTKSQSFRRVVAKSFNVPMLDRFNEGLMRVRNTLRYMAPFMVGYGLYNFLNETIDQAYELDKALTQLRVRSNLIVTQTMDENSKTAQRMNEQYTILQEKALRIGKDTALSNQEAVLGMSKLFSLGNSYSTILGNVSGATEGLMDKVVRLYEVMGMELPIDQVSMLMDSTIKKFSFLGREINETTEGYEYFVQMAKQAGIALEDINELSPQQRMLAAADYVSDIYTQARTLTALEPRDFQQLVRSMRAAGSQEYYSEKLSELTAMGGLMRTAGLTPADAGVAMVNIQRALGMMASDVAARGGQRKKGTLAMLAQMFGMDVTKEDTAELATLVSDPETGKFKSIANILKLFNTMMTDVKPELVEERVDKMYQGYEKLSTALQERGAEVTPLTREEFLKQLPSGELPAAQRASMWRGLLNTIGLGAVAGLQGAAIEMPARVISLMETSTDDYKKYLEIIKATNSEFAESFEGGELKTKEAVMEYIASMKFTGFEALNFMTKLMESSKGITFEMHEFMKEQAWYQRTLFEGSVETFRDQLGLTFMETLSTMHMHGESFIDQMTDTLKDPAIKMAFADLGIGLIKGLKAGWEFTKRIANSLLDLFEPVINTVMNLFDALTGSSSEFMTRMERLGKIVGGLLAGSLGVKLITTLLKVRTTMKGMGQGVRNLITNLRSGAVAFNQFGTAATQAGGMVQTATGAMTTRAMTTGAMTDRQLRNMQYSRLPLKRGEWSKVMDQTGLTQRGLRLLTGESAYHSGRYKNYVSEIPKNMRHDYLGPGKRWLEATVYKKTGLPYLHGGFQKWNMKDWVKYGAGRTAGGISALMGKAGQVPLLGQLGRMIKGHPILAALTIGGGISRVSDKISAEFEKGVGEGILGAIEWSSRGVLAQGLDIVNSIGGFALDMLDMLGISFAGDLKTWLNDSVESAIDYLEGRTPTVNLKVQTEEFDEESLRTSTKNMQSALEKSGTTDFFGVGNYKKMIRDLEPLQNKFIKFQAELRNRLGEDGITDEQRQMFETYIDQLRSANTELRTAIAEGRFPEVVDSFTMVNDIMGEVNKTAQQSDLNLTALMGKYSALNATLLPFMNTLIELGYTSVQTGEKIPTLLKQAVTDNLSHLSGMLNIDTFTKDVYNQLEDSFTDYGLDFKKTKILWPVIQKIASDPDITPEEISKAVESKFIDPFKDSITRALEYMGKDTADSAKTIMTRGLIDSITKTIDMAPAEIDKQLETFKKTMLEQIEKKESSITSREPSMAARIGGVMYSLGIDTKETEKAKQLKELLNGLTIETLASEQQMMSFFNELDGILDGTSLEVDGIINKLSALSAELRESDENFLDLKEQWKLYESEKNVKSLQSAIGNLIDEVDVSDFGRSLKEGLILLGGHSQTAQEDIKKLNDEFKNTKLVVDLLKNTTIDFDEDSGEYVVHVKDEVAKLEYQFALTKEGLKTFKRELQTFDPTQGPGELVPLLNNISYLFGDATTKAAKLYQLLEKLPFINFGDIKRGLDSLNLPTRPHAIPRGPNALEFAEGGVVRNAQYGLVGEAGPEAVIPIDRYLEHFEKIAGTSGGSSTPVTYNNNATYNVNVTVPEGVSREEAVEIVRDALYTKEQEDARRSFAEKAKGIGITDNRRY